MPWLDTAPWYKVYGYAMQPSPSVLILKDRWPMGAKSFFVMILILEPDQPRASRPARRLHRFLAVISCTSSIYTLRTTLHLVPFKLSSTSSSFLFANLFQAARRSTLWERRKHETIYQSSPGLSVKWFSLLLIYDDFKKNFVLAFIVFPVTHSLAIFYRIWITDELSKNLNY